MDEHDEFRFGGRTMFAGSLALTGLAFLGMSLAADPIHLELGWGAANFILAAPW